MYNKIKIGTHAKKDKPKGLIYSAGTNGGSHHKYYQN